MGKQVRTRGKREFSREFRKDLFRSWSLRSAWRGMGSGSIWALITVLLVVGVLCFFYPYALLVAVVCGLFATGAYYASAAIAAWKYDRWLDACVKKYLNPLQGQPVAKEIIRCGCGQELRIPCIAKRLKITCPACGSQFER